MTRNYEKCYKFQDKLGNTNDGMCLGMQAAFLKAYMLGSKSKYLKVMSYSIKYKCSKCDKLISSFDVNSKNNNS